MRGGGGGRGGVRQELMFPRPGKKGGREFPPMRGQKGGKKKKKIHRQFHGEKKRIPLVGGFFFFQEEERGVSCQVD